VVASPPGAALAGRDLGFVTVAGGQGESLPRPISVADRVSPAVPSSTDLGITSRRKVASDVCNLIAACLCTLGSGIGTFALFMSEPTPINRLAAWGAAVGTVGGIAWIGGAIVAFLEGRDEQQ
jgi:hypothetical protein